MERAGHKIDEVIQSLRLLWGLDHIRLGPIYESFFVCGDKDITKMMYKQVAALQSFESQFPGVQYPHYKKMMEKQHLPNLESADLVRTSGAWISAGDHWPGDTWLGKKDLLDEAV